MSVPRGAKKDKKTGKVLRPAETMSFASEVVTSREKPSVLVGERVS